MPEVIFSAGGSPTSLAIGDLDGDTKPDLVATRALNSVAVLRNLTSGSTISVSSFAGEVSFATGSNPVSVAVGDLDGDGKSDLAVVNNSSNTVSILRNAEPPVIDSFTPSEGCSGNAIVTITGSNFIGATGVQMGGTPVNSFVVNSSTEISAVIGAGTTGLISVHTPQGVAYSTTNFNVTPIPTWYLDADNDNYSIGAGVVQCESPGVDYKSIGLLGVDCNDNNENITSQCTEFVTVWNMANWGYAEQIFLTWLQQEMSISLGKN